MSGKAEYAIVQVRDSSRAETLNAAIAIFSSHGLDIRVPRRLDKLRAISQALDIEKVRESLLHLIDLDAANIEMGITGTSERLQFMSDMTPFTFSGVGSFVAASVDMYEGWANRLLRLMVEPEPAIHRTSRKRTPLSGALRAALRRERILAKSGEDLSAHRIVPNYQIAEGLAADFVLKNGAMHVIETVDVASENTTLRKAVTDIAISALVLEQARMTFGEKDTRSRIIYDATAVMEKLAAPSLQAAAHQGAILINWASHDDRRKFIVEMSSLADPLPEKGSNKSLNINASNQPRLKLN